MSGDGQPAVAARGADSALNSLVARERSLRDAGLRALGIHDDEAVRPLRGWADGGRGRYPLAALAGLALAVATELWLVTLLAADIQGALGVSRTTFAFLSTFLTVALLVGILAGARLGASRGRRARLAIAGGCGYGSLLCLAGMTSSALSLAVVLVAAGVGRGIAGALHRPLLVDTYPPGTRGRVLSLYRGAELAGVAVAGLLTAAFVHGLDLTWRAVLLVAGGLGILAGVAAVRLRDPGTGVADEMRVRLAADPEGGRAPEAAVRRTLTESVRSLASPAVAGVLVGYLALGTLLAPAYFELSRFLDAEWHSQLPVRLSFIGIVAAASAVALGIGGRHVERQAADPAALARTAGALLLGGSAAVAAGALVPVFGAAVVITGGGLVVAVLAAPRLDTLLMTLVRADDRAVASGAAEAVTVAGAGLLAGSLIVSVRSRYGFAPGLFVPLLFTGVGRVALRRTERTAADDLGRIVDRVVEETEVQRVRRAGRPLPVLACRHVDFSYHRVQVLFDMNVSVGDGEIVGVLGSNGAGKSTLLGVMSGLLGAQRGSIRLDGIDITGTSPERRVASGISHIPGGRAVFRRLSVEENLRLYGWSLRRDHRAVGEAMDRVFETFPALAERRRQLASTLSGGERQMLALGKALMLRPRVLLVDELSLGLAPIIVGQLLPMIGQIRDQGSAVVLVEQSVNLTLSLVDRAYFIEKGTVQFEGSAAQLLGRDDLLSAAMLAGAVNAPGDDADRGGNP